MKKILILFVMTTFCLDAGRGRMSFPTAPATQKECDTQKYLKRVLQRLNINQARKQQLIQDLAKTISSDNCKTRNELLETLAVLNALEQTMLLQACIGQGEVEQEQSFFQKRRPLEDGLEVTEIRG